MFNMKHLLITTIILSLSNVGVFQDASYSASLNKIIDEVTKNLKLSGKEIGIEPLLIPDFHKEYVKGEVFDLTNGVVSNVVSVERYQDAQASYSSGILNVKVGFKFTNLKTDFNFNAKIFGLNPDGTVSAIIPDLGATIQLVVDAVKINATLEELLVPTVGDIQLDVKTTAPIYGKLIEALVNTFTTLFQDEIVYIIGRVMQEKVNEFIQDILNV